MNSNKKKSAIKRSRIIIALFFYGSVVGFTTSKDPTEKTWIDFVAGFGNFTKVVRDCNGNVINHDDYPFIDGGISLHEKYGALSVTGKINAYRSTRKTFKLSSYYYDSLPNQFYSIGVGAAIGVNFPYLGLDLGAMYFSDLRNGDFPVYGSHIQPMGRLRLGFEDKWFFSTNLFYNTSPLSNGGMFDMGLGFRIKDSRSQLWFGVGGGPYSDVQWIIRGEIAPKEWKPVLLFSGNVGFGEDGSIEYGLSAGLRFDLH